MSKINKKLIVYSLGILAILTFATITMPAKGNAYYDDEEVYGGSGSAKWCSNCFVASDAPNTPPAVYNPPVYTPPTPVYNPPAYVPAPAPTPIVYTNSVNPNQTNRMATASSSNSARNTDSNYSGLAANAVFGSNSFMPSGLVQWVLFGIIILLLIIAVRKFFGTSERYHNEPLKHA